jgi:hypothetical protein
MSAEIGVVAQARSFQAMNDLPPNLTVAHVTSCKAFRFKAPVLRLKIVSESLNGEKKSESELEARPWQEISMALIPLENSHCDVPNVSAAGIELYANAAGEPVNTANVDKKKNKATRNHFRYHAHSVEIEDQSESTFDICLDGIAYGPFERIVISPCVVKEKVQTVNIMSYF